MKQMKKKKELALIISAVILFSLSVFFILGGTFFAENEGKASRDLTAQINPLLPESRLTVVVQYGDEPQSQDFSLLSTLGAAVLKELPIIHALIVDIPSGRIDELAQSTRVKRISPDREVQACLDIAAPTVGANNSIAYYNLTGRGVTVAVLDSGITPSDKLTTSAGKSRVVASVDFVNDRTLAGFDYYGHGTHVSGVIGMKTSSDSSGRITLTGIAPEANIASIRVLDSYGKGKVSSVIEGIQWCADHAALFNIRVLNLSLSHPISESYTTDPLTQACEKAWDSGLAVVVAAGNHGLDQNGYGTIGSPGNDPFVITAGASSDLDSLNREDDLLPGFSSKGPSQVDYILKPDLVAPGTRIFSIRTAGSYLDTTFPLNRVSLDGQTYPYFRLNGTSVSAAIVSGTAALMLEKEPSLTPSTIKARLMKSADKLFSANIYKRGAGYLNIVSALLETGTATSCRSPRVIETIMGVDLEQVYWGPGGFWEDIWIWGDQISWGEDDIYGDLTLWGSSALPAYQSSWVSGNSEEDTITR